MSAIADQVHELMNEFDQEDQKQKKMAEWIENLPEEQLMEALRTLNPYGPVTNKKVNEEEQVSLSYTNLRMEYAKRLAAVSLVAFTQRMVKEYRVPEEVKAVDPEDYLADPTILDTPAHITDPRLQAKWAENRETMAERVAIWRFFKHIFDFDPDRHVASALQTNVKDPQRKAPDTRAVRTAVTAKKNAIRNVKRADYEATVADLTPLTKKNADGSAFLDENGQEVAVLNEVEQAAFGTIPPQDMFAKWDRYQEEHYEELIGATAAVYGIQPDVELLVNVYDVHKTKKDAQKFKDQHMDQFRAPVTLLQKGRWAILGPYRENRERVDFLNRKTEILKEMIDQRERDSHVATDIMKKRIKTKKAENVAEAGADDKAFRRYLKTNKPSVAAMGGEHVTNDDSEDDCPPDAVEVNVFTVGDGGRELKVHKIYNQVEAPKARDDSAASSSSAPTKVYASEEEPRPSHAELVGGASNLVRTTLE